MRCNERKVTMSFDYTRIGERIRYYRTKAGMSQSDLAEALFISSNQYISRLESGKAFPSLELIIAMAELFHISTDDLLTNGTLQDEKFMDSEEFSDCPPEYRTIMLKIMKAIKNILMEDYRK